MRLVLAVCGYSGAGKTTLIVALLPRLAARGLRVGVLKHDTHRLTLDAAGKDTARFFEAGAAAVSAHDPGQHFVRIREAGPVPLSDVLARMPLDLDLVLVEGHKSSPGPKLALEHPEGRPPIDAGEVVATLPAGDGRVEAAEAAVVAWLEAAWARRPLGVALFVGGRPFAAGAPGGALVPGAPDVAPQLTRLEALSDRFLLVGGDLRTAERGLSLGLPDLPGVEGPLAGLLGLLRYDPDRAWLCVARGQRDFGEAQARWLCAERRPGRWAVLPRLRPEAPEPFGAIYEPTLLLGIERAVAAGTRAVHRVLAEAPVAATEPPPELAPGWRNLEHEERG
ncbi:MAG: molybdopterin-guanine dinucleotide biosynthesis protein B [Polyangiaceae bacterium]|nr:molybdopterin-guanine dinucleotide biosynthesis protein B [Polyangiaceae bacterium]